MKAAGSCYIRRSSVEEQWAASVNHNHRAAFHSSRPLRQNEPLVVTESFLLWRNQSTWSHRRCSLWGYLCRELAFQTFK